MHPDVDKMFIYCKAQPHNLNIKAIVGITGKTYTFSPSNR